MPGISQNGDLQEAAKRIETVTTFATMGYYSPQWFLVVHCRARIRQVLLGKVLDPAMIDRSTTDWTVAEDATLSKYGRHEMGHGG
jgi:hypothetical protein